MKSLKSDQRGIAHLVLISGVVVIVAIAGVGYYVFSKQKKSDSTTTAKSSVAINSAALDECKKAYNDADICKFSVSYKDNAAYKASFTTVDKDGKSSTFSMDSDGKGNSSTTSKEGSTETGAYISLNGDTYVKNVADGSWTKYPKSPQTSAATQTENPTSDLKIDTDESKPAEQRITYKKLSKEKCGNATCFKYQVIDPSQPNTESIVWFGDKDYQLHKWSFKDTDGSTNVGEFNYTSVTISAPSPVKEAAAAPSQAEIEQALQQAQQSAGSDSE